MLGRIGCDGKLEWGWDLSLECVCQQRAVLVGEESINVLVKREKSRSIYLLTVVSGPFVGDMGMLVCSCVVSVNLVSQTGVPRPSPVPVCEHTQSPQTIGSCLITHAD